MRRLVVLVIGVGLLGGAQFGDGEVRHSAASQAAVYADYFGTNHPVLDLAPAAANGGADLSGSEAPVPAFPEPATMMLFGLGLLGLASFKRRFK